MVRVLGSGFLAQTLKHRYSLPRLMPEIGATRRGHSKRRKCKTQLVGTRRLGSGAWFGLFGINAEAQEQTFKM